MPNWEEIQKEWETSKVTLATLAEKYDVKLGTLKSRKSRDGKDGNPWNRDATKKDATKTQKVASDNDNTSWVEIETEYTTDIRKKPCTLKSLADKYGVSERRVEEYAANNNWAIKRGKYAETLREKTVAKTAELISDDAAAVTARHFDISKKLLDVLEDAVNTPGEFNKVVEKLRVGEFGEEEIRVEQIDAFAEKRLASVVTSLANLQKMQRQTLDVMNMREQLALEQAHLNIDKTKTEIETLKDDNKDEKVEIVIRRKEARG